MIKARTLILGTAMLGIAVLCIFGYQQSRVDHLAAGPAEAGKTDFVPESADAVSTSKSKHDSKEFSLETSSLRGTEVDGGVSLDADGLVLVDIGMRHLFDYYLSLVGERDATQIRALLKDYLSGKYSPANTETVLGYFDRYTDYLNELGSLNIGGLANPEDRLASAAALRRKMLGEEMAHAFFAEEELLATLTLKRLAIANDKKLGPEAKAKLLAELDSSMNYSARTEADTAALIAEQTNQLDELKLTDAQRKTEREALWGKEVAGRLSQLDQQRAQWDRRVDDYLLARSRIDANRNLSESARTRAIAALRAQQFNDSEQRRIASLEAIGQLKPGG